ncbi:hypothetical protein GCM10011396_38270 [Undibacterium terreum]|uniref:Uncharacterized protein n=1 Tax=Undibacterium terreum TaxID=1224302 RepID=A0A916XNH0_9BURK|nr:hypothetical protein GCM10011396_38270 [Undibacterium terreum]
MGQFSVQINKRAWIIVGLLLGLAVWIAFWTYDESRALGRVERRIDKLRAEQQKSAIP